ncbi:MAG: hypothetical protein WBN18_13390 [Flavobacteriaceae bacterium]
MKHYDLFRAKRTILLVLVFGAATFLNSCKRAAEKTSEKMIEESIGGDAKVDIDDQKVVIETDEGTFTTDANVNSWPEDVPSDVPEFNEGSVIGASTQSLEGTDNWVIMFEKVPKKALEDYKKRLENAGFTISYTTVAGSGGQLGAEKDDLSVMLMMGDGNATVTVSQDQ